MKISHSNMQCRIIGCENLAQYPYPACNSLHGLMLKTAKNTIKQLKENPNDSFVLLQWKHYFESDRPTEEEIKQYE